MKFIYLLLIISMISCKQNKATDATDETQTTSKESIVQPVEQATITGNVINYEGDKGPINIFIPPLKAFHILFFIGTHLGIHFGGSSGKSGILNLGIPS